MAAYASAGAEGPDRTCTNWLAGVPAATSVGSARARSVSGTSMPTPNSTMTSIIERVRTAINRHPDRFLFGTDEVAPSDQDGYLRVYRLYQPLFAQLTPSASEQVRKGNYLRLFDEARRKVRAWEQAVKKSTQ